MSNVVQVNVKANDETRGFAGIKAGLEQALGGLAGIAKAAGADIAASLAGPIAAGAGVAVAAFASAGAALGAFGAAVKPQLGLISGAVAEYDAANKAIADGSADGAEKMKAFNESLAKLPPATRDTAIAFLGLRDDFKAWSDELAPKTMPVFTKGIEILRSVLPGLTPLVEAAADSLSGFMDTIKADVSGGGVQKFFGKLADAARNVLPGLLASLKNVVVGIAGVVGAFLPFTANLGGGMERLTAKFAAFGQGLGSNPAFIKFMQDATAKGPAILGMLGNLLRIIGSVAQALAPFTGLTLIVAEALAKLVASIPQGVMDWLAPAIAGIVLGIRAWAVVQGILNIALAANPIGLVVLAIAALVAGLIYAYKNSETFRNIVNAAWNSVKDTVSGAWNTIKPVLKELASFFKETVVPAVAEVKKKFDDLGSTVEGLPGKLSGLKDGLKDIGGKVDLGGIDVGKGPNVDKGAFAKTLEVMVEPWRKAFSMVSGIIGDGLGMITGFFEEHWGTIAAINEEAFSELTDFFSEAWQTILTVWEEGLNGLVSVVQAIFNGIAWYLLDLLDEIGDILTFWLPPVHEAWDDAMKTLQDTVHGGINGVFNTVKRGISNVIGALRKLPGQVASIARGAWTSLSTRLSSVAASVSRTAGSMWRAIPNSLNAAASSVYGILGRLAGWVGNKLSSIRSSISSAISSIPGFAHGGIVGAAGGGPRSNLVEVGEQGRELVRLPFGSTVIPHGQSEAMLGGGGGGGGRIQLEWVGGNGGDEFMTWLKKNIRATSGSGPDSVQRALGV